jgi:Cd2+/Zn2+-exporting ATPase
LFYLEIIPLTVLLAATAFGLYALLKTAILELIKERKVGTEFLFP